MNKIRVELPDGAKAVLDRTMTIDGAVYAKVTMWVPLVRSEPGARRQLLMALAGLAALVSRVASIGRPAPYERGAV